MNKILENIENNHKYALNELKFIQDTKIVDNLCKDISFLLEAIQMSYDLHLIYSKYHNKIFPSREEWIDDLFRSQKEND